MNRTTNPFLTKLPVAIATLGCALLGSVSEVQAVDYFLSDNNSTAVVDVNSAAGMKFWSVDGGGLGGVNQLNQQWFWYRIGSSGPQYAVNTINPSTPIISQPSANQLSVIYANGTLSVEIDYQMTGLGGGDGDILESLHIAATGGPLSDVHFFQYSDFDLGGSGLNDTVHIGIGGVPPGYNQADQTAGLQHLAEVVNDPPAQRGEAGLNGSPLNNITSGSTYDLNNVVDAGPGDASWALEWNYDTIDGAGQDIFKDKLLSVHEVPEPSALALVAVGLGAFALRRRAQA